MPYFLILPEGGEKTRKYLFKYFDPLSPPFPHVILAVSDITQLLHDARRGDSKAEELLLNQIYSELHHLAVRFLSSERPDHTLQPSALVNETYLKLFGKKSTDWENRSHFYVSAARSMRRILVDYARSQSALKRPNRKQRVEMSNVLEIVRERSQEFVALDQALERLAAGPGNRIHRDYCWNTRLHGAGTAARKTGRRGGGYLCVRRAAV